MVSIIVAFKKQTDAVNIRNLLTRFGYNVVGVCTSGAAALNLIDHLQYCRTACTHPDHIIPKPRQQISYVCRIRLLLKSYNYADHPIHLGFSVCRLKSDSI